MLIFLVGYMGCGKSSIGRALATRLKMPFVDMDTLIEQRAGVPVREIFARDGEEAFRRLEQQVLAEVIQRDQAIVATGGGVPCFFDNMEVMNRSGLTIYLQMGAEKLASRLEGGRSKRPLLRDKSPEELVAFIRENVKRREPYYLQAKMVMEGDGVGDRYLADHIALYVQNHQS